jgi:hypothetical protein
METAIKTQSKGSGKTCKTANAGHKVPKRLSKAGQWMLDHPNGIGIIVDRRAVNR